MAVVLRVYSDHRTREMWLLWNRITAEYSSKMILKIISPYSFGIPRLVTRINICVVPFLPSPAMDRKDLAPWTCPCILLLSLSLSLSLWTHLDMEYDDTSPPPPPPLSLADPPARVEPEAVQMGQPSPPRLEWLEPDPQQTPVPSLVPGLQIETGGVLLQQSMEEVVPA
jgi:hypothetical protein